VFQLAYRSIRFPIRRPDTVIGRSAYCSIVIDAPTVSRQHARLLWSGSTLEIVDLESRNGTSVNGKRITRRVLQAGDLIALGSELLVVEAAVVDRIKETGRMFGDEHSTARFEFKPTLEQVESMVSLARTAANPRAIARDLRNVIDLVTDDLAKTGDRSRKIRALATAEIVASWVEDGSFDIWCKMVAHRLGLKDV
jgi:hypothetical protein